MVRKQTISLTECMEIMRANLMSISQPTLEQGIKDGVFPFADYILPGKQAVYLIYRKKLYAWLKERVEEETYTEV